MEMAERMEKEDYPKFARMLWTIWYARNALIFRNTTLSPDQMMETSHRHAAEYAAAQLRATPFPRRAEPVG